MPLVDTQVVAKGRILENAFENRHTGTHGAENEVRERGEH